MCVGKFKNKKTGRHIERKLLVTQRLFCAFCLVLTVILHTEHPDVLLYPIMLSLEWLKPQSLLPIIGNRTSPEVLLLFSGSVKRLAGIY